MPPVLSGDVMDVIVQALNRGLSSSHISGVVGVSPRTIARIRANLRNHGTARPPSKGVKIGRPTKLTKSQTAAMVTWMSERNHSFYISELVQFLRENHGFRGVGATMRRSLMRNGYQIKRPWRKSEVTTWIPPSHGAHISIAEDAPHPDTETETHDVAVVAEDVEDEDVDSTEQAIDPELQDAPSSSTQVSSPTRSRRREPRPTSNTLNSHASTLEESTLPPSPYTNASITPHPQAASPLRASGRSSKKRARKTSAATPAQPRERQHDDGETQISTLQSQIAQQQAMIESLQRQLAQRSS